MSTFKSYSNSYFQPGKNEFKNNQRKTKRLTNGSVYRIWISSVLSVIFKFNTIKKLMKNEY